MPVDPPVAHWFWMDQHFAHSTLFLIGTMGLAWTSLELLTHTFAKERFIHLLKGNPKYAGQRQKQERTAVQMCPRLVCFVHNALQVPLALMILLDPFFNQNTIWATNDFSTFVMAISAGYFLYDSFECLLRLEQEGWDFLLHGVFCCLTYSNLTFTNYMHFYGAGCLLWELSTPFMHLRWVLYQMGKANTKFYKFNALTGMLAFFLCRVVWGSALAYMVLWHTHKALQTPKGQAKLSLPVVWYYRLTVVLLNVLNVWWFSKMVKLLLAAVKQKDIAKKTR